MRKNQLISVLFICLLLAGCWGSSSRPKAKPYAGPPIKLAMIAGNTVDPGDKFWKSARAGAEQAASELGKNVELVWFDSVRENDASEQIELVDQLIEQKVSGVVLAPVDSQALTPIVKSANSAGIPVVTFERSVDESVPIAAHVGTDHSNAGALAADALADAINKQGNVIVLQAEFGDQSGQQRSDGVLKRLEDFKKINVVSSDQRGGATNESAQNKTRELLKIFGDELSGIIVVGPSNATGVMTALNKTSTAADVKIVAFGVRDTVIDSVKSGKCVAAVIQDSDEIGYQAVIAMVRSIETGEPVVVVPPASHVVTSDNLSEKRIKRLLQ